MTITVEMILKTVLFIVLSFSCVGAIYFVRKKKILKIFFKNAYDSLDNAALERQGNGRRDILIKQWTRQNESFLSKLLSRPEKRYTYSRLETKTGMSFEIWIVLKIVITALIYLILTALSKKLFISLISALGFFLIISLGEYYLAHKNYKIVDDNMLQFVNLLSNFTITASELTSIFYKASVFLPDPLKTVLEECHYDAQTCGNVSVALYAMLEKIEHPLFKDFIRNLEVCVNYTANYSTLISGSRKSIREEQKAKKERKAIATENIMELIIVDFALLGALGLTSMLLDTSIFHVIFTTAVGIVAIAIVLICHFIFAITVIDAEK